MSGGDPGPKPELSNDEVIRLQLERQERQQKLIAEEEAQLAAEREADPVDEDNYWTRLAFADNETGWPGSASWIETAYGEFSKRAWHELEEIIGPYSDGDAAARAAYEILQEFAQWSETRDIKHADRFLSVRKAAKVGDVAERTVRRWIADGVLPTLEIVGPRGMEHRIFIPTLYRVMQQRAGALARPTSPMDGMQQAVLEMREQNRRVVDEVAKESETLRSVADELKAKLDADAKVASALRDIIEKQQETIQRMANEMHDMRGQMHDMHEQVLKALPAPTPDPWWRRILRPKGP
jgi:uncharacterized coiled-coil protein SlyX